MIVVDEEMEVATAAAIAKLAEKKANIINIVRMEANRQRVAVQVLYLDEYE